MRTKSQFRSVAIIFALLLGYSGNAQNIDPSFTSGNQYVNQIAQQSTGKIIVVNAFMDSYNGNPAKGIARLNADGTFDPTFFTTISGFGNSGFAYDRHLLIDNADRIIIVGQFTSVHGVPRTDIVRLNSNGTVDNFNPRIHVDGPITRAVINPSDNKIYISGTFTSYDGVSLSGIARLNPDGSLDTDFNPTTPNYGILAVQNDGKPIALGGPGGVVFTRFNIDGSIDPSFSPALLPPFIAIFAGGLGNIAKISPDNKIYFVWLQSVGESMYPSRLNRYNADGTEDTGYNPALGISNFGSITSLDVTGSGKIIVCGNEIWSGSNNGVFRLNADGSTDNTFTSPLTSPYAADAVLQPDGNLVLAASFPGGSTLNRLLLPELAIQSFSPIQGYVNTTVTINGTGFDPTASNNLVELNGTPAVVTAPNTSTTLTIMVPAGATSGPISVTTSAGTAISPSPFIINATYSPFGNTVNLTGVPDHIEVVDHPALRPSSLTVEAWIKASTLQDFGLVASKPVGNFTQNSYALWFEGGKLAGGVNPIGLATAITYDWVPVINQWYHVAFTYDDNTHVQVLYLNGAVVATGTGSTPDYDGQPFLIGADINFGTLGAHFPGFMDELRFWNVARTQTEIQATLNITLSGTEPGLAAYYRMDEVSRGAGLTVNNSALATGTQLNGLTYGTSCSPIFTLNAVSIISFNPVTGMAGTSVTLDGNNFDATPVNNTVTFNGTAATVTAATTTSLTVMVPVGAVTGPITVTTPCGTQSTSNTNFNVICTPPATPAGNNAGRCGSGSVTVSASGGTAGQYRWYPLAVGGSADATQQNASFNTPAISSTTSFWVAVNDGSCESSRVEVIATITPLPAPPQAQQPEPVCPSTAVTLTASGGTEGNYRWYDNGNLIVGAVNSAFTLNNLSSAKTLEVSILEVCESTRTAVTASIKNCTAPSVESTVATALLNGIVAINLENLISDPEDDLDPASLQIIEQPQSGASATLEGFNLTIDYSGIAFSGTDRVTVGICDLTNLCTEQAVTIELGGAIKIYNAVSPNGDGKNEIFFIQYIDLLPETQRNTVIIYNRWGDEVFQTKNYDNTSNVFKGESNTGDQLPSGTYFYKIIFTSGKTRTGFLELKH